MKKMPLAREKDFPDSPLDITVSPRPRDFQYSEFLLILIPFYKGGS